LQAEWNGTIFHDPNQEVRVTFLYGKHPGNPVLELVEPAGRRVAGHPILKAGRRACTTYVT